MSATAGNPDGGECSRSPRIVDAGSRGSQLALLLESGDWIAASDDGNTISSTTGAPLPGQARMLAIAGDDETFWALGRLNAPEAEAVLNPSTEPATSPTSLPAVVATTAPAGAQFQSAGPPRIVLFLLKEGNWTPLAQLPPELGMANTLRLSITRHVPYVAVLQSPRSVRVIHLDTESKTWIETTDVETTANVSSLRLISGGPTPTLWIAQASGDQSLYYFSQTLPPRIVRLPSSAPAIASKQAIAFAAGRIHLLSPADGKNAGKLIDQNLDADTGARSGPATLVPLVSADGYPEVGGPMQFVIWAALAFAIGSSLRWRKLMQGRVFDLQELHLAPLGLRLVAGLVDLAPALTPLLLLIRHPDASPQTILEIFEFAVAPLYLLHTTAIEAAFGRSLGKIVIGLRVVSIDGSAPTLSSLLIRNLLRIIDIGLMFLPLIVIFFSRLRQRTGDVAAGTLVVRMPVAGETELVGPSKSDETPDAETSGRE